MISYSNLRSFSWLPWDSAVPVVSAERTFGSTADAYTLQPSFRG